MIFHITRVQQIYMHSVYVFSKCWKKLSEVLEREKNVPTMCHTTLQQMTNTFVGVHIIGLNEICYKRWPLSSQTCRPDSRSPGDVYCI